MTEEKYRVVFSGKLAEGEEIQRVKKRLAALFKASPRKIEALFKRPLATIRHNLDLKTARQYVQKIADAGAVCGIERMGPARELPKSASPPKKKDAMPQGPRVVPVTLSEARIGFSPFVIAKITGTPDGLDFNKMDVPETPFEQITALAVVTEAENHREKNRLLLFTASDKRPFICEAKNIVYTDFPIEREASTLITLRHFISFLCDRNPSLILEESSFDFLSGKPPKRLNPEEIIKLATGLGSLLEKD